MTLNTIDNLINHVMKKSLKRQTPLIIGNISVIKLVTSFVIISVTFTILQH